MRMTRGVWASGSVAAVVFTCLLACAAAGEPERGFVAPVFINGLWNITVTDANFTRQGKLLDDIWGVIQRAGVGVPLQPLFDCRISFSSEVSGDVEIAPSDDPEPDMRRLLSFAFASSSAKHFTAVGSLMGAFAGLSFTVTAAEPHDLIVSVFDAKTGAPSTVIVATRLDAEGNKTFMQRFGPMGTLAVLFAARLLMRSWMRNKSRDDRAALGAAGTAAARSVPQQQQQRAAPQQGQQGARPAGDASGKTSSLRHQGLTAEGMAVLRGDQQAAAASADDVEPKKTK